MTILGPKNGAFPSPGAFRDKDGVPTCRLKVYVKQYCFWTKSRTNVSKMLPHDTTMISTIHHGIFHCLPTDSKNNNQSFVCFSPLVPTRIAIILSSNFHPSMASSFRGASLLRYPSFLPANLGRWWLVSTHYPAGIVVVKKILSQPTWRM